MSACISKGDTNIGAQEGNVKADPEETDTDESTHDAAAVEEDTAQVSDESAGEETSLTGDSTGESPAPTGDVPETPGPAPTGDEPSNQADTSDPGDTSAEQPAEETTPSSDTAVDVPDEPVKEGKCTRQEPVPLTDNSSAKRGLGVATDGTVIMASWQGLPSGKVKAQYVLASNEDLEAFTDAPISLEDVEGADEFTGYNEVSFSPSTGQFMLTWANYYGANVYPGARLISAEGDESEVVPELGGFITFYAGGGGRHRTAWYGGKFFLGYYWCASGGSGCPYAAQDNPINRGAWLMVDDETGVVTQPADGGSPYPGAHNGTQILQVLGFSDPEAEVEGFLGLNYDGASAVSLIQYRLDGSYASSPWLWNGAAMAGNNNAKSKFVWSGSRAYVLSQGSGFGSMQGPGLRQESWDFAGEQQYVEKLTTEEIDPHGLQLEDNTLAILAGNASALYFLRSDLEGEVVLEPEVIATGDDIRSPSLLRDEQGWLAVYLAKVEGTDQVVATRIECE